MKLRTFFLFLTMTLILSGCFYPNERRTENQMPQPDQIEVVQKSVNQYKEETGVLPIETKDGDTPIYEKYVIDFRKLMPKYLSRLPSNSYEEGGVYRYVLVDVEDNPKVKLLDLRLSTQVGRLQLRVNEYLQNNYLPVDQIIDKREGYFSLNYEELNLKEEPMVQSPYSLQNLPFVVNKDGVVGIDYRIDLYQALQNRNYEDIEEGQDIRFILLEQGFFVPAYSFPYTIKDGEPVFFHSK
jgi:hypothetical protein